MSQPSIEALDCCTGSSVAPSELNKVTTSRAKDLAAVLACNKSVSGLTIPGGYLRPAAFEAICSSAKVSFWMLWQMPWVSCSNLEYELTMQMSFDLMCNCRIS